MNRKTKYIRDAILQTVQAEQSPRLGVVEVEQKINIGRRSIVTAGDGTEEVQMHNASGLEFRLVLAEDAEDALLVHSLMVTGVQVRDKRSDGQCMARKLEPRPERRMPSFFICTSLLVLDPGLLHARSCLGTRLSQHISLEALPERDLYNLVIARRVINLGGVNNAASNSVKFYPVAALQKAGVLSSVQGREPIGKNPIFSMCDIPLSR